VAVPSYGEHTLTDALSPAASSSIDCEAEKICPNWSIGHPGVAFK